MSDYLPFELQVEIIKRLPVKSLIQYRSVSKEWKSLIDSSEFIHGYSGALQLQYLFVRFEDSFDHRKKKKYFLIADDSSLPQQKYPLTIPPLGHIIGSSHGLLCLYYNYIDHDSDVRRVALWNPSIRKTVIIVEPGVRYQNHTTVIGFGVCLETIDPKVVKLSRNLLETGSWEVEVFTLSTGEWRRSSCNNPPQGSIKFRRCQELVGGFIYWLVEKMDDETRSCNLILSFDITNEEFSEINLPDSLALRTHSDMGMSKLRESLVVLDYDIDDNSLICSVWMMEDSDPKSFTKLFIVSPHTNALSFVCGFRKTGEVIIKMYEGRSQRLFVYDPYSKHIKNLGIDGVRLSRHVFSYMESLLLLDQPNLKVYNEKKPRISR